MSNTDEPYVPPTASTNPEPSREVVKETVDSPKASIERIEASEKALPPPPPPPPPSVDYEKRGVSRENIQRG